jgi:hypothetical protein
MQRQPQTATGFQWDAGNLSKLAARNITKDDVEAVFAGRPRWSRNKRRGTAEWLMTGPDGSGRRLTIGVLWADEQRRVLRAITGWPV